MSYEINGVHYESWSSKNQRILDRLIDREVYCCMTAEVEYMLSRAYLGDEDNPIEESDLFTTYQKQCSECKCVGDFASVPIRLLKDEQFKRVTYFDSGIKELISGYQCPACLSAYASIEEARKCCEDETVKQCENCDAIFSEDEYNELDETPVEVYEWWAVSKWFGEKLAEQGCVVIDSWGKSYWGRQTTGQSISLDGCIVNIAKKMGILEGMEHEWSP